MSTPRNPLLAGHWFTNELALIVAIGCVVLFTLAVDSNRAYYNRRDESVQEISRQVAMLGIFALGAAVVIISGGIDLSLGSTIATCGVACAAIVLALTPQSYAPSMWQSTGICIAAIGGSIVTGLMIGTLHTWLITSIKLPPFVATLATLVGLRSLARAFCDYVNVKVTGTGGSKININNPIFVFIRDNVWVSVVVLIAMVLVTWFVLSKTVLGRHIYALGGNEQAARLSGIRTENVKWAAYCFSSFTASIAAIFYLANSSVADPVTQARGHELNAIAAAVVGGCALQGGIGTVPGTLLGVIFLRVVVDGVSKMIKSQAETYEGLIVGAVVVAAVTLTQAKQLLSSGRQMFAGFRGSAAILALTLFSGLVALVTLGHWNALIISIVILIVLSGIKLSERQPSRV
ncbi:ABC transporter permease [Anatilimnocola sp. NA78]|uniref:ABC transporter permease n=1 Tax=Anatilimnocola sp. NA78 TaxID=3415683 RepID=UPI003CE5702B